MGEVPVVPLFLGLQNHPGPGGPEWTPEDLLGRDLVSLQGEARQATSQRFQWQTGVDEGAENHVTTQAGERVKISRGSHNLSLTVKSLPSKNLSSGSLPRVNTFENCLNSTLI